MRRHFVVPAAVLACVTIADASAHAPSRAEGAWGVAYAPGSSAPRPAPPIVYLHGMWASPEDSCAFFARGATSAGFLVCPRGNAPLGLGRMWSGTYASVAPSLRLALDAAAKMDPGGLDRSGDGTLIGYSNGAYFAVEVACAEGGRWTGLVLLSMHLELDAGRLRSAGVRRVLLGAGERDGARQSMEALAGRLREGGLPARFASLGPGGHEFPGDMAERMCDAITWVRGADATPQGSAACAAASVPSVPSGPSRAPPR